MIYIFQVDIGRMITLDFGVDMGSSFNAASLMQHIENSFNIPVEKQVLLKSGGVCLDPDEMITGSIAGNETNPIFLFNLITVEAEQSPALTTEQTSETDLQAKVKEYCAMPGTVSTVIKRASLAQHFHELAKDMFNICETIVHDQHLMQQGWMAAIANLEDLIIDFRRKSEIFEKNFMHFLELRMGYVEMLKHFYDDLDVLQRIPLLPVLLESEHENFPDTSKTSEETESTSQEMDVRKDTLFDWVAAAGKQKAKDLIEIYEWSLDNLQKMDGRNFKILKAESDTIVGDASEMSVKEIKGLGERLSGLEILMRDAKKYVRHQSELAQSFLNNQNRVSNTNDASVLPDLCISHKKQLQMTADNHQALLCIKRRCIKAKDELKIALYHRLKWMNYIENKILDITHRMGMTHDCLQVLRKYLEVFRQIHSAAEAYLSAVAEVVRRRSFSESYLLWTSGVAQHSLTVHIDEVTRRKEFESRFGNHFVIKSLFPGIEEQPPAFATDAPSDCDAILPKITLADIERLKKELPDLTANLNIQYSSDFNQVSLLKLLNKKGDKAERTIQEESGNADADSKVIKEQLSTPLAAHILKDMDRGCESETDTEEFEKVGQSPLEQQHHTRDAATYTEDDLQISRSEHEKIKASLLNMHSVTTEAITQWRSELQELKIQIIANKKNLSEECANKSSSWNLLIKDKCEKDKELLDSLMKNHEVLIKDFREKQEEDSHHIETLKSNNAILEAKIQSLHKNFEQEKRQNQDKLCSIKQLEHQIREKEDKYQKTVKEISDRFTKEKVELEHHLAEDKKQNLEIVEELKNQLVQKEDEWEQSLKKLTDHFNSEILELNDHLSKEKKLNEDNLKEIDELKRRITEKEDDYERMAKELSDRLNREHKAEVENLRSRFKLMTMEKSPSETNLEKSGDFSSLPNNPSLLVQMTENFEMDKEKAINDALSIEREKWEKLMAKQAQELETKFEEDKEDLRKDIFKMVSEEKDKQLEALMEREKNLNLECIKYKSTIQQLAEFGKDDENELLERISVLEKEKDLLQEELNQIKNEKVADMSTSVAVVEAKCDETISQKKVTSRSEIATSRAGTLNIYSCKPGDQVLVVWDSNHECFEVLQENKQLIYFLRRSSLVHLGLKVIDGKPNKIHCLGEVSNVELCLAKKFPNRYKVPKGTRFYRIRVLPIRTASTSKDVSQSLYCPKMESQEVSRMSQSQTAIPSTFDVPQPMSPTRAHPMILERDEVDGNAVPQLEMSEYDDPDEGIVQQLEISELDDNDGTIILQEERLEQSNKEKQFAEDSGIVESIEHAAVAFDETFNTDSTNTVENDNRNTLCEEKLDGLRTYINSTWLEMMISRVFSKSVQNSE